jgi:hypothetical protein
MRALDPNTTADARAEIAAYLLLAGDVVLSLDPLRAPDRLRRLQVDVRAGQRRRAGLECAAGHVDSKWEPVAAAWPRKNPTRTFRPSAPALVMRSSNWGS